MSNEKKPLMTDLLLVVGRCLILTYGLAPKLVTHFQNKRPYVKQDKYIYLQVTTWLVSLGGKARPLLKIPVIALLFCTLFLKTASRLHFPLNMRWKDSEENRQRKKTSEVMGLLCLPQNINFLTHAQVSRSSEGNWSFEWQAGSWRKSESCVMRRVYPVSADISMTTGLCLSPETGVQ